MGGNGADDTTGVDKPAADKPAAKPAPPKPATPAPPKPATPAPPKPDEGLEQHKAWERMKTLCPEHSAFIDDFVNANGDTAKTEAMQRDPAFSKILKKGLSDPAVRPQFKKIFQLDDDQLETMDDMIALEKKVGGDPEC